MSEKKTTKFLRIFPIFFIITSLAWAAGCSAKQGNLSHLPHQKTHKEILNNGLTVLIKEDNSYPVVTARITFGAGISSESSYAGSGISHFVEHLVFNGTLDMPASSVRSKIKSMGGVTNGFTGLDKTEYYITVPTKNAYEAIKLLGDITFNPAFREEDVGKEKGVILSEIRLNLDDPSSRVMRSLWDTAYLEHPYKFPVIGYEDSLKSLKREDLVRYHKSRYSTNNAILTIAGDVKKDSVLSEIKNIFNNYKMGENPNIAVPLESGQNSSRKSTDYMETNLGYLAMGYHTISMPNKDLHALDVLGIILGDWDGSRLNKKLVKNDKLLYAVSSMSYTPKYPGLFIIYGVGDYKNLELARNGILDIIDKLKSGDIRDDELFAAKNIVISHYIQSLETSAGLASQISQGEFFTGDPEFFKNYVDAVKLLKKDDILHVAKKYLNKANLTVSYLYPNYVLDNSENDVDQVPHVYVPEKIEIRNGIRLVLKEDHRIPKVSIVGAFLGGTRVESEMDNGISNLTSAVLLKGTNSRNESEIKPFIEKNGGMISHFSGKNSLGISLSVLSDNLESSLDVFEDVLTNPSFPRDEIDKEKDKILAAIKAEENDIYSVGFQSLSKELFPRNPYGFRIIGEEASVKALDREDLISFHKKFFTAENLVIAVSGDFDPLFLRSLIEKKFSRMPHKAIDIEPNKPLALNDLKEKSVQMDKKQSMVVIGFRGTTVDNRDKYPLQILTSILSGENGRLYSKIRDDLGISYAQGAFQNAGLDTGYIITYVATDEINIEKTKKIMLEELGKIKKGDIKNEEVALAKSELVGRHEISLERQNVISYAMGLNELYGIGYDSYMDYSRNITITTKDEVVKVAKKYFINDESAIVTIIGNKGE